MKDDIVLGLMIRLFIQRYVNYSTHKNTWQDMVIKVTSNYIDLNLKNIVNELISTSNRHQGQVTNLFEQVACQQDKISLALINLISATNGAKKLQLLL